MAKKVINIISTVILVLLVVAVVILFITRISGNAPSLFGYQVFRVSSGSMEPVLMKGDVILVQKVPMSDIQNGDIITYKSREGKMKGQMITHRVVEDPVINNGTYCFQTKGDIEGAGLDPVVYGEQVQGRYVKKLPFIDKIYSFFFTPYGLISFVFVIMFLFGFELLSLIRAYRSLDEKDDDYYEPTAKKPSKKRKKK